MPSALPNPVMMPSAPMPIAAGKLCSDLDLTREELVALLALAHEVKRYPARYTRALAGQYISLMFEKPSLRTRLTFELAIKQLGGDAVVHNGPIDGREPVKDMARNLDRWTQAIVARTFSQSTIDELAKWSTVPVVNALSDLYHPCQALADMQTLEERCGDLRGLTLAFVGDGNNMSHSLMLSAIRLGMNFNLATPEGYTANAGIVAMARDLAEAEGARLFVTNEPELAAAGAHAVYTDVWASMGQESEAEERKGSFAPFQVNDALLSQARPDAVFMHCLPAKRGQEVTDSVMESERSLVFEQAENRLHAQKALLLMLLA